MVTLLLDLKVTERSGLGLELLEDLKAVLG